MSKLAYSQNNLVSLELKDAPVRTTIELVFKQAGIKNYLIDNEVAGVITMTITEQPLESTLKLIMRAATLPLTYTKENNVYIVKVRKVNENKTFSEPPKIDKFESSPGVIFERIPLTFIDPLDLQILFGPILNNNQFRRFRGNSMFGGQFGGNGGMGMGGFGMGMGGFGSGANF